MEKTFIIAEIGANHDRNFSQALTLIKAAKDCGADAVKFQTYSSETMYSKNTPDFAGYKNIPELIKSIELPRHWQKDLKNYCNEQSIEFISTPFDYKAVDELVELNLSYIKIASFEATDKNFIQYIAKTGKTIIFSTGIMDANQFKETMGWIYQTNPNSHVIAMHCISSYPTPIEQSNLNSIRYLHRLKNLFNNASKRADLFKVGFSDHSEGIDIVPLAIAAGAQYIEKHFTLSRTFKGPDHSFALEPDEFKKMVEKIRLTEQIMGEIDMFVQPCAKEYLKASRSVVAARAIPKNKIIEKEDLITKRPYLGQEYFQAKELDYLIGKFASIDIQEDEMIKKSMIKEKL